MKSLSLRKRVTILVVILLIVNTVILAVALNISAVKMTNMIEIVPAQNKEVVATKLIPATEVTLLESVVAESRQVFRFESILYSALIIIIGGVVTYFVVGKALTSVTLLNEQVKRINVQNLNEQIEYVDTKDEISELAKSFNNMTEKLENSVKFQRQFSLNVAHELKTPLAVMQTKIDVFKKKAIYTDVEYGKLIQLFEKNTTKLSDLVNDIMTFSNHENITLDNEFSCKEVIENIFSDLSLIAKSKKVSLSISGDDVLLCGNQSLLSRLFYNLIENAIKYNKTNGSVVVELCSSVTENIIRVIDTGEGIPTRLKQRVFDAFYQVDQSRSISGVGLGLSISYNIVEKHNGKIEILDNDPEGSIIQVLLSKSNDGKNI